MPFPYLANNGFKALENSAEFQCNALDPGIKYESTGGIVIARRRYTRQAPRQLQTGFTDMLDVYKLQFDAFFQACGTHTPFSYTHPTTGEVISVRFDDVYKTKYIGAGTTFLWEITDIKLREVNL